MAPSSRKTAPSSTTAISTTARSDTNTGPRKQSLTRQLKSALTDGKGFGRVTKSSRLNLRVQFSEIEKDAFSKDVHQVEHVVVLDTCREKLVEDARTGSDEDSTLLQSSQSGSSKRKRGDVSESETEDGDLSERAHVIVREQSKKRRVCSHEQLLSPPASRDGIDCNTSSSLNGRVALSPRTRRVNATLPALVELPQSLLDLISMHAAFLKALTLHYAHNGASSPAELGALMDSMTRLWKKQNVRKVDVQRMLGLYEVAVNPMQAAMKQVDQKSSPFTIVTSGLGTNVRSNLEYVGQSSYSENMLQATFSDMVHNCFKSRPTIDDVTSIPLLTIRLGLQTSLHRAKAASTRADILSLSASAQPRSTPDFSKLSIVDPSDHTPAAVKSRTLSLFDRVRAKGLAAANSTAPTPAQITRQHAIGRTCEVVEFLRMKQQQKLSTQFHSSVHDSPGSLRGLGKVSFSLGAIVRDIQQSVGVPIGDEEVKVCLRMLSQELPGEWCRMIEFGSVVSITLQGNGMSGIEARRLLQERTLRV